MERRDFLKAYLGRGPGQVRPEATPAPSEAGTPAKRQPRFIAHTGIAAAFRWTDAEIGSIAPREASILLADETFGTGSLQAEGPARLASSGIRVVVAPSFDPAFYSGCFEHGLLPVTLERDVVERIVSHVEESPEVETTVDLARQVIERPDMVAVPFEMDPAGRNRLLLGMDDLGQRLQHDDRARARRDEDRASRPWIYGNDRR